MPRRLDELAPFTADRLRRGGPPEHFELYEADAPHARERGDAWAA